MGFLRQLFGPKKPPPPSSPAASPISESKPKKRWGFPRSRVAGTRNALQPYSRTSAAADNLDAGKHAIAVAAATAAVAEAALAAAHAAAEVVRLTNSGGGRRWGEIVAAVKIQSAFRGYLARRALRALKALVKLQAVVRGHIVRKQTADMVRRMHTLVRVQARARAGRANTAEALHFSSKTSRSHHPVPSSPDKNELRVRAYSTKFDGTGILKRCGSNSELRETIVGDKPRTGSNWLDQWMEENVWNNGRETKSRHGDDEKSEKILEVDTWRPPPTSQPINIHQRSPRHCARSESPSNKSPKSIPSRSEWSWSYHPNYMSTTESFCAKARSQSAPRQRMEHGVRSGVAVLTRNGSANFR